MASTSKLEGRVGMKFPEVTASLRAMQPSTHAALIYDSPENKREVLFEHLKVGQPGSKSVYVCSEERPDEIRREMESEKIDVESLERDKRLSVLSYEDVYIGRDGTVDIPKIINGFASLAFESKRQGTCMRGAGEMSCFFKRGKVVELVEYEKALGKRFYFPGIGVCAFNVLEMQAAGCLDLLMPLLRAHGPVILTGPSGAVMLQSERVDEERVEKAMEIRIPSR